METERKFRLHLCHLLVGPQLRQLRAFGLVIGRVQQVVEQGSMDLIGDVHPVVDAHPDEVVVRGDAGEGNHRPPHVQRPESIVEAVFGFNDTLSSATRVNQTLDSRAKHGDPGIRDDDVMHVCGVTHVCVCVCACVCVCVVFVNSLRQFADVGKYPFISQKIKTFFFVFYIFDKK